MVQEQSCLHTDSVGKTLLCVRKGRSTDFGATSLVAWIQPYSAMSSQGHFCSPRNLQEAGMQISFPATDPETVL